MYRYHRPRRWRGRFFLPFIFFAVFANFGHGPVGILTWVVPIIIILALAAMVRDRWSMYQQPYQNNQSSPYNQNAYSDQYYRPQQPYTSYQQGYRVQERAEQPHEMYQEGERAYSSAQQEQYQEYEQPQAQYPEQMPPMQ